MSDNAKENLDQPKAPMSSEAFAKMLEYSTENDIPIDTQNMLNRPTTDPEELDGADQEFLEMVIEMIESKKINLYRTSSLMNQSEYDKLSNEAKAKAEIDALNLLNTMREIHQLYQKKQTDTYQFKNKLHQFRLTKERLEEEAGDIFII